MTSGQLKILICSLGKKSKCGSLFEAVGVNEISRGERKEAEGPPTEQNGGPSIRHRRGLTASSATSL